MLVERSVMEQRYQAVLAVVQDGWKVSEVAERLGVSRQSVHPWIARFEAGGRPSLAVDVRYQRLGDLPAEVIDHRGGHVHRYDSPVGRGGKRQASSPGAQVHKGRRLAPCWCRKARSSRGSVPCLRS